MNIKYDVAIVGGGIVGLLTSLALAKSECKIIHIEKEGLQVKNDNRSIAISYSSIAFLNTLGLWDKVKNKAYAIKNVHVSDKGKYGRAIICAKDENLPFLGAIVPMQDLLAVALHSVDNNPNIFKSFSTNVVDLSRNEDQYSLIVKYKDEIKNIKASLIIACDGANSGIRSILNVSANTTDYQQDALVFDIATDLDNHNTAFERFMTDGILAMLPKSKTTMGCVWTINREDSKAKIELDYKSFESLLQDRFGYRLGQIKLISKPAVFPLYLVQSDQIYKSNVLFFGNALHFLHPVSGQGMNLSIRDIGVLYDLIVECDFSCNSVKNILEEFAKIRKADHDRTIFITHGFVKWFVSDDIKLIISRNLGLHLLQRSKLAKRKLSRLMMGKLSKGSTLMRKVVENDS
ncbi:MAG: FAD-dependent monooxygenase [Francisella sp.]